MTEDRTPPPKPFVLEVEDEADPAAAPPVPEALPEGLSLIHISEPTRPY